MFSEFNEKTKDLKEKIYKKYSKNLDCIKNDLILAIVSIYGDKYLDLVAKKINQIHLVNFFNEDDLRLNFLTERIFIPKVLDSNEESSEPDELDISLFDLDDIFPSDDSNKIFDKDVYDYLNLCLEYQPPFEPISYNANTNTIIESKSTRSFKQYSSMFSCLKDELSNLNILLNSQILYNRLMKYFSYNKSYLIHNVNNNLDKVDIILINPFKFAQRDIAHFIFNIIRSINTDLIIEPNKPFIFNSGLLDIFEKSNFTPLNDLFNEFTDFTDFVNERIAFEVINYLNNHNRTIFGYQPIPDFNLYHFNTHFSNLFYNFKRLFLDAIITKKNSFLFKTIGEENYKNFIKATYESSQLPYNDDTKARSTELYQIINNLLNEMKTFSDNKD